VVKSVITAQFERYYTNRFFMGLVKADNLQQQLWSFSSESEGTEGHQVGSQGLQTFSIQFYGW
jgi:hypothetical protein